MSDYCQVILSGAGYEIIEKDYTTFYIHFGYNLILLLVTHLLTGTIYLIDLVTQYSCKLFTSNMLSKLWNALVNESRENNVGVTSKFCLGQHKW